jgi:hypothetical protein
MVVLLCSRVDCLIRHRGGAPRDMLVKASACLWTTGITRDGHSLISCEMGATALSPMQYESTSYALNQGPHM